MAEIPTGHSANPQNLSRAVATHCLISGGLILVGMYISRNTEVMFKHTHIGAWRGATEIWGMNPAWARLTISTTDAIPSFILLRNKNYTVLPCPLIRASYVLLIVFRHETVYTYGQEDKLIVLQYVRKKIKMALE